MYERIEINTYTAEDLALEVTLVEDLLGGIMMKFNRLSQSKNSSGEEKKKISHFWYFIDLEIVIMIMWYSMKQRKKYINQAIKGLSDDIYDHVRIALTIKDQ